MKKSFCIIFLMCIFTLYTAIMFAEETDTNTVLQAKILLADRDKEYIVDVTDIQENTLIVQREFKKGSFATEKYTPEKVKAVLFPPPAYLMITQDFSTAESIAKEVAAAEEAYSYWQRFSAFPGSRWHIPLTYRLAVAKEKAGKYADALKLYSQFLKDAPDSATAEEIPLRLAVCKYHLENKQEAKTALNTCLAAAENDATRAEALYYIGTLQAEEKAITNAVFTFMRNKVFYTMQDEWAPKSMTQILPLFAQMDRKDDYIRICNDIITSYPDTVYSSFAEECLHRATNSLTLTNLVIYTLPVKE